MPRRRRHRVVRGLLGAVGLVLVHATVEPRVPRSRADAPGGVADASAGLRPEFPAPPAEVVARVRARDDEGALAAFAALAPEVRGRPELVYLEGVVALRSGDFARATERLLAVDEASLPADLRVGLETARIRALARSGEPAHALARIRALPAPGAELSRLAAECALDLGRADEALTWLGEATNTPLGEAVRAEALLAAGRRDAARATLRAAYLRDPGDAVASTLRRRLVALDGALPVSPGEAEHLVAALAARRRFDAALADVAALELPPHEVAARRGRLLLEARRPEEAVREFLRALDLAPRDFPGRADVGFLAARALARTGDDRGAIARLDALPGAGSPAARYLATTLAFLVPGTGGIARAEALLADPRGLSARERGRLKVLVALDHLHRGPGDAIGPAITRACGRGTPLEASTCAHLEGLAALSRGDAGRAKRAFERVVVLAPRSLDALFAHLRLAELGERPASETRSPAAAEAVELAAAVAATPDGTTLDVLGLVDANPRPRPEAPLAALPHATWIAPIARAYGVDLAYVYGTMRTESAFRPNAQSRVGALGLLQLMPDTAARAAERLGLPPPTIPALLDPRTNVPLGVAEMRTLLARYEGTYPLVAAAYNAGPHKVDAWLLAYEGAPLEVLLLAIPFEETRGYVRRVLGHALRYGATEPSWDPRTLVPSLRTPRPRGPRHD